MTFAPKMVAKRPNEMGTKRPTNLFDIIDNLCVIDDIKYGLFF